MKDWAERLDKFLEFNEYGILEDKGKVSKVVAENKADKEYNQFRVKQDREYKSDFDMLMENVNEIK